MPIDRIEVYLNNAAQPVEVLRQPPFKVTYDTRNLPDGDHTLRVVTHYTGGGTEVKEIPFKVANTPGVMVQGLEEGKPVSGNLDVTLRVGDPEVRATRERFPGVAAAVATAVILGGVWLFFAATGATNKTLEEVAKPPAAAEGEAHGGTAAAAGPVSEVLFKQGETLYTQSCAGCHQANGTGNPPAFPALAGDKNLADTARVVSTIHRGKGAMPAVGAAYTDEQLAAVSTYVRNAWGNKFGGVTAEEAAAAK